MRTENSIKNILFSIISQIIILLLGFATRKVFIDSLGTEYLGINGVLTNILSMLSLVESGIGISIVFNLYAPLAENNQKKVQALIALYKKLYMIIAAGVFVLSLCLFPFLHVIIKDSQGIPGLAIYYFIFVLRNIITYFNAHKWSLITADQKGYFLTISNTLFQIIFSITKIIVLLTTQDYILFLIIDILIYLIQNIVNGRIVDKRYPYIKDKTPILLDSETKQNIFINVKALFLHQIGSFVVFGTDNLLISSFIGTVTVGLYSNYIMIINQLTTILNQVIQGVGASVGHLVATETSEKNYCIFKVLYLVNFWIYSVGVIFLYNLVEPFISWWIGEEYLLGHSTFICLLVSFYLTGMRASIGVFKDKAGIFDQDKYFSLFEAAINLILSILLVKLIGINGIFIGTIISTLLTVFWNVPRLTYKYVFKKSLLEYFLTYTAYVLLMLVVGCLTTAVCNYLILGRSFVQLVFKGIISLIIPNIIYLCLFYKSSEMQFIFSVVNSKIFEKLIIRK